MKCPNRQCASTNTQRLQVIYEKDSRDSILSRKVTPPQKRDLGDLGIGGFLIIVGLSCFGSTNIILKIIGLAMSGFGVRSIYRDFKFNFKEFNAEYTFWKQSWYCNKCGKIFHEVESYVEYDND